MPSRKQSKSKEAAAKPMSNKGKPTKARAAKKASDEQTNLVQLKIELRDTDITRTIIIPEDTDLFKCAGIIMEVFGWNGSHLWEYEIDRNTRYIVPSEFDADMESLGVKSHDARKATIGGLLKKSGDKIVFAYDSGDGWEHVVTRMAKPKFDTPCCCSREGTMGIDDIGGPWVLKQFTEKMLKYETSPASKRDKAFRRELEWHGFGTKEKRIEFLNGPGPFELSLMVRAILQAKI